jgi:hypothetical protein
MDFSRLDRNRVILGALGGSMLFLSLLFLPWYSLTDTPQREQQNAWICGTGEFECTGFETFPIMRWLLIAGAFAPLILAWILVRGHELAWAPGELTMVVGFVAILLIGYNGIIDRPAPDDGTEFGIGLKYGYWIALLGAIAIAATGFLRSLEGQARERKAPGTV